MATLEWQHSNNKRKEQKTVGVVEYESSAELTASFFLCSNPIKTVISLFRHLEIYFLPF